MTIWTRSRRTISLISAMAAASIVVSAAQAATPQRAHHGAAHPKAAKRAPAHAAAAHAHGLKFRPPRGAAAQDAKRLGALAGKECTGRADMQRNEHQWVVLCSNGKTFVVEPAAPNQAAPPALECSLAGTGPQPPCFP
jgi:hypothetical protein